ncbi:PAS domain S-box protein [Planctomycetota bacterium]
MADKSMPSGHPIGFEPTRQSDVAQRKLAEDQLVVFQKFSEASEQALGMADLEGNITYANPTLCRLLGVQSPDVVCGTNVASFYLERDQPTLQNTILPAVMEKGHQEVELPLVSVDGKVTDVIQSIFLIRDDKGSPIRLANVITDISERKRAEEELKRHRDHLEDIVAERTQDLVESEQRYRTLFENASDAIFLMQEMTFVDCNSRVLEMFARTRDQIVGKNPMDLSPPFQPDGLSSPDKAQALLKRAYEGHPQCFEWQHVRPDGTFFDAEVSLNRLDLTEQVLMLALVRDITERKKTETRFAENQEKLRSLASELSLTEERQRRKIATWLHDNACQNLALAKMKLQVLQAAMENPAEQTMDEVIDMVDRVLRSMRSLSIDLSSTTLYMFGLEAAVEQMLQDQLVSKQGIDFTLHGDKEARHISEDLCILLYQSVRELIINIIKHAQATEVTVDIKTQSNNIAVSVKDNGIGFDINRVEMSKAGGFGLFNIRERLQYVGGRFEIQSSPGQGTCITLMCPIGEENKKPSSYLTDTD